MVHLHGSQSTARLQAELCGAQISATQKLVAFLQASPAGAAETLLEDLQRGGIHPSLGLLGGLLSGFWHPQRQCSGGHCLSWDLEALLLQWAAQPSPNPRMVRHLHGFFCIQKFCFYRLGHECPSTGITPNSCHGPTQTRTSRGSVMELAAHSRSAAAIRGPRDQALKARLWLWLQSCFRARPPCPESSLANHGFRQPGNSFICCASRYTNRALQLPLPSAQTDITAPQRRQTKPEAGLATPCLEGTHTLPRARGQNRQEEGTTFWEP